MRRRRGLRRRSGRHARHRHAAASPGLRFRQALKQDDLRDWVPTAPILLCGGSEDPTVFWLNAQLMQGYWARHAPASATIRVLDRDSNSTAGDVYADLKSRFSIVKQVAAATAVAQGASDGRAAAVADTYLAGLLPPFCVAAVRTLFAVR